MLPMVSRHGVAPRLFEEMIGLAQPEVVEEDLVQLVVVVLPVCTST